MPCSGYETAATRHWACFEICSLGEGRDLAHFVSPDGKNVPEGLVRFFGLFFGGCFWLGGRFLTETFPVFFAEMYFMTILLCRFLPLWTLHRVT